jgi:hypothetical protein
MTSRDGDKKSYKIPANVRKTFPRACMLASAAHLLGISLSEMRRRVADGIYPFVVDRRGWKWFDQTALENTMNVDVLPPNTSRKSVKAINRPQISTANVQKSSGYSGAEAKKVFDALGRGGSIVTIVREHGLHPEIVEAIQATWHRVQGQILITAEAKKAIESLPLQGELPIRDSDHLIELIARSVNIQTPCGQCGRHHARFCTSCTQQIALSMGGGNSYRDAPIASASPAPTASPAGSPVGSPVASPVTVNADPQ